MSRSTARRLRERIKRLEAENAFLRLRTSSAAHDADETSHRGGYLSYLWQSAKRHTLYRGVERLTKYFSRFRLISHLLKLVGIIAIAVETSAVIFIISVFAAIILPPTALIFPGIFLCSAFSFKRDTERLVSELGDSKIIVWFIPRQYRYGSDSFFYRNALELSSRGYTVIAVTPFILSAKGLTDSKKYFLNLRRESNGVFIIRHQYFFHIRKKLLGDSIRKTTYVY